MFSPWMYSKRTILTRRSSATWVALPQSQRSSTLMRGCPWLSFGVDHNAHEAVIQDFVVADSAGIFQRILRGRRRLALTRRALFGIFGSRSVSFDVSFAWCGWFTWRVQMKNRIPLSVVTTVALLLALCPMGFAGDVTPPENVPAKIEWNAANGQLCVRYHGVDIFTGRCELRRPAGENRNRRKCVFRPR